MYHHLMCSFSPTCEAVANKKNCFRYLKLMSPLKNNYLTLRSKVKVPRRSLQYATHRLMVMHPHTKYHCPIWKDKPEALKSLYRSPGNKKNQLVLCKNYVLRHLGITINIKNTKFVKDLPMIDAQFRFNQCNSFREEYISVFSPYVLC
jgi:hypothetical protein